MIILESTKTPKYIVGFGPTDIPVVVWMDVLNIKEPLEGISFMEDDETYKYVFNTKDNEYVEVRNKAPRFTRYEILTEEELFEKGYLKSFRAENTLDFLDALGDILGDDYDDDEDYDDDDYEEDEVDDEDDSYRGHSRYTSYVGCGWHGRSNCGYSGCGYSGCGGGYYGGC